MTKLLEKAFSVASKLSDEEQDAIATLIMEEFLSEQRWTQAFARSQDQLSQLADEAIEECKQGRTKPWDL